LKENIHLLPHIDGESGVFEPENNLEHACIHALGAFAGEGFFWEDVGFDATDFERHGFFPRAFEEGNASAAFADGRRIGFIHINAELELRNVAEEDGWFGGIHHRVFTGPDIDLEDSAVARCADCEQVQAHRSAGHCVVMTTATNRFITELTAAHLGIEPAARITCVKPEGTASLVLGRR
jgi:hypothetical protein